MGYAEAVRGKNSFTIDQLRAAVDSFGSVRKAAKELGIPRTTLRRRISEKQTSISESNVVGRSTLIDCRSGEAVLEWVKTSENKNKTDVFHAVLEGLKESLPKFSPIIQQGETNSDLLNAYVLTDYHLGMLAWGEETGAEDWDMKIAEKALMNWFYYAIEQSPNSETALFAQMGDFDHWDGLDAVTPAHGNLLDADTRFQKLVRATIRISRKIIELLLKKHKTVHVKWMDANHDPASSAWMREWLCAVYEKEPRITIDTSADAYYCFEWGDTSLFFHHGHKRNVKNVDDVFVAKFRDVFGRTKHSYAHLGHLHSNELHETPLMQVERHRTLAAPDAYEAKGGWISGREAKVITYSKRFGEVSRLVINPEMVSCQ